RPQRGADMHVPGQRGGAAIAADLGRGEGVGLVAGAEATVLLWNGDAEQAGPVHVAIVLGRKHRPTVIGGRPPGEQRLSKLPRPRDDGGLFAIQPEGGGIEDRRIERDPVGAGCAMIDAEGHRFVTPVAAGWALRNWPSVALNCFGRSRLTRWPAPSNST